MKYETANEFFNRCLGLVLHGYKGTLLDNPAYAFTRDAKAGMYDLVCDEDYCDMEQDVEQLSSLWDDNPSLSPAELLINALSRTSVPPESLETIADVLSECAAITTYSPKKEKDKSVREYAKEKKLSERISQSGAAEDPRILYAKLCERIRGQEAAKKAASMIVFDHMHGRRSNSLFYGPSGCGKSEIWRRVSAEIPGLVRIIDASRLSADGWKGSIHLRDIFDGIPDTVLREHGAIIVLDEADKVFCETIVSGSGTDHSALIQNTLLKMLDGDVISFGNEGAMQEAFSVDCSKVSVVLLGAFEKLHKKKRSAKTRSIGFALPASAADPAAAGNCGARPVACGSDAQGSADIVCGEAELISYDDLINSGMRREVAGRINRLVPLEALSVSDYETILETNILGDLEKGGRKVEIDPAGVRLLAEKAESSGLGVRYMLSRVISELDELVFADPTADRYRIQIEQ